ncbi:MAG TPA: hypothetical protein P5194_01245 [Patescibacteria group bacterium]|nr:hypothetical protein [bacterium]HRT11154.1 hypothetical protein [Patescibacteria group bacterium]HRU89993.1 hypothetical protein [Patescibacteria group bacterium]
MKLKHYLLINLGAMIIFWLLWLVILFKVDPLTTNWLGRGLFYLTLFAAIFSTMSLFGFILRFSLIRQQLARQAVITAFRQAALIAIGVVIALWLLSRQLLGWFNLFILVAGLVMLEFFMLSCQSQNTRLSAQKISKHATSKDIISSTFKENH